MRSRQELLYLVFTFAFVICGQMMAESNPGACDPGQSASYQGIAPDEFMTKWLVLGPIPISGDDSRPDDEAQKKAFAIDLLTDQGGETGIQPEPESVYKIGDAEYSWKLVQSESDIVDLEEVYGRKEFAVAYAWAEIESPEAAELVFGIGSDDGVKVWLNGELVHENWIGRAVTKDDDIVGISLRKGKNQLLLKIQNGILDWGFACRAISSESLADTLINAVAGGNMDTIQMLLSRGVDVNAKDKRNLTALHTARILGREDMVNLLLEKGADSNIEMPSNKSLVDSIFQEATEGDSAGVAVLIARDGKILHQNGFGYANLEDKVPVTPDTKFRIGSITKQFTASAILKLQEDGLLSVDDKLTKFIPDYPRGDEVTIHHLLTHTSGIHSYTSKSGFMDTVAEEVKPADLIESFRNDKFDFDPGEQWLYNNSGYFLLGYIVEKVSGKSLASYLKETFFDPLGMENTGIHRWDLDLENEAVGYSYNYDSGSFQEALKWDMSRAGGAGAIYSTVGDLYLWNEAVFGGKVLSESSLKAAFTPVKLNSGDEASAGYGYGWMISEERGLKEIHHGGGFNGFNAYLLRYPDENFTAAVLTNCAPRPAPKKGSVGLGASDGAQLASYFYLWKQMDTIKSFPEDETVDPKIYDDYVGRYDYGMSIVLSVTKEEGQLFAQLTGQEKYEIFPRSETEFFWKVVDAQVTFVRDEKGKVTHAFHQQSGREFKAPKLKDEAVIDVDPAVYDAYVGDYQYGPAVLKVTREGDKLFVQMTGQPKFEIFPSSETEFFLKVVNARIKFVKNDKGEVVKSIINQGGMETEFPKAK